MIISTSENTRSLRCHRHSDAHVHIRTFRSSFLGALCSSHFGKRLFAFVFLFATSSELDAKCVGRFVNPITDVCWSCIFPIAIGGMPVVKGEDTPNPSSPICLCPKPPIPLLPGLTVSFWEPVRLIEATRTPYCLVSMGGLEVMKTGVRQRGTVATGASHQKRSFYQVHYYIYPLIVWLELLTDFICLEKGGFDVGYLTELDPFWDDDAGSFVLNPEAILFSNPAAQAACAADCGLASVGFSNDALFWCAGCQGSMYPFTGTVSHHVGGVQASLLVTNRILAKLHRQMMLKNTSATSISGICSPTLAPLIKKTQYKTQMVYPKPDTKKGCHPLGRTEVIWGSGREYPNTGEDFSYLLWRKRNCCVF